MSIVAAPLSGLLLVNKPSGPTSYDVIRWIKRAIKGVKIGHCGTLDPLASGLLIILLGKATKRQSEFMGKDKVYRGTLRLGLETATGDTDGKIIRDETPPTVSTKLIEEIFGRFLGPQQQIPPMYSALKHEGVPLYKLARKGETIERPPRSIIINKLEFIGIHKADIEFRVECSSGTYVRTLVEDIAKALGTCAALSSLVRESIGDKNISGSLPGDHLKNMTAEEIWQQVQS